MCWVSEMAQCRTRPETLLLPKEGLPVLVMHDQGCCADQHVRIDTAHAK